MMRGVTNRRNSLSKAKSRRKSTVPIFSKAEMQSPRPSASITVANRGSRKNPAAGYATAATSAAVERLRRTFIVNAVS